MRYGLHDIEKADVYEVLLTGVKEGSTQHWRMLSLLQGGQDVETGGLSESISFVTRELIHVRRNWTGDQRRKWSLGKQASFPPSSMSSLESPDSFVAPAYTGLTKRH